MSAIKLRIDDHVVEVPKGSTILDAARKAGSYVPALCDHPDLKPVGSCKLCIVSVEGLDHYPMACNTPAKEGMVVQTKTEELQEMRRHTLEMLLALTNHPTSCLFCDRKNDCSDLRECMRKFPVTVGCKYCPKNEECELQQAVRFVGLENIRYQISFKNRPVLREPFFDRNYNLCIMCSRCVRACQEVRGEGVLSNNPDFHRMHWIGPESLQDSDCKFCGTCVDICPTGALYARSEKWQKPERTVSTVCPYCGVGCRIEVGVLDNRLVKVRGKRDCLPNGGQLCVKGRFGLGFVESPERLTAPLIRKNDKLVPATWEEALDFVAGKLNGYKGDSFAFLSSAKCSNEENYLAQKFARLVMQTNNVDHCARLCHASTVSALALAFGSGAMTNSISEIADAGCIFIIGSNTSEQHPVIALKIKEAKKKGAKIIVANPRWIDLCKIADVWLRQTPGTDVPLVLEMCRIILEEKLMDEDFISQRTEGFEEFKASLLKLSASDAARITGVKSELLRDAARLYARGNPSSIIYSMGITQHSHGVDNIFSLANLALMTGNLGRPSAGINPLRGQNNVQGSCDMGALPNLLPAYQAVTNPDLLKKFELAWGAALPDKPGLTVVELMNAAYDGKIRAMYIMGENPVVSDPDCSHVVEALKALEFLVVQDIFLSETAALADVVLPATTSLEKDGTFTNTERRVQRIRKVLPPIGESMPDWMILDALAARMGWESQFSYGHPSEIMSEAAMLAPSYGGISYERLEGDGLQWPCPNIEHPGTGYLHKGRFTRGLGKFNVVDYRPSMELPDEEYPFILTTGRVLCQYHTGTMTRKVGDLNILRGEELVEMNPQDAITLSIEDGELIEVASRRGKVKAKAKTTEKSPVGVVFMTFHFSETPTNVLTNAALDPVAKIPEFKVCAVKVSKIRGE
ncbi:MAG: formate dehydrogenase subunit alpha [Methanothrix sp.]|jgi:formate dehydrogenase alpha subunit|nr:formate dehydrogenase subunit alpha [Methanothrix sp.]